MQNLKTLIVSILTLSATSLIADVNTTPSQQQEATIQPDWIITPVVAPKVKDGVSAIISADFIWWKTHIGAMEYAISGINDIGANVPNYTNVSKGHTHQPDFDFKPGFKVGLGMDFAHDGWDLIAEYTWLQGGSQKNSFTSEEGVGSATSLNVVDPVGAIMIMSVESGRSTWKQSFNVVDLMLGRNFFVSRYLSLKPSVGLKSAWIDEKLNLGFITTPPAVAIDGVTSVKQQRKQDMWGLGIRLGLDGVWHFAKNWGLYGNIDATALWSDFHVRAKTKTVALLPPNQTSSITTTNLNTEESIQEVMGVLEASLGLTYMTWFHRDEYQFQVQAGWEEQVWLNFNHFVENPKSGDLSLQGLTIKASFKF